MNAPTPLFRKEVIQARATRLHGDVSVAVPLSWQLIGYFLLAILLIAGVFLVLAPYSRVEQVPGAIVLDKGIASIMPSRPGVVTAIPVRDGQQVRFGDLLAQVRSEDNVAAGEVGSSRELAALETQERRLSTQSALTMEAAAAGRSSNLAEIAGLRRELGEIDAQIVVQHRLVDVADNEYRTIQGVAARGFISRHALEAEEAILLTRRQDLARLEQTRVSKQADLLRAERAIAQSEASARAQAAEIDSNRVALTQQRVQAEVSQGYRLTSPLDGRVTALTARPGQATTAQQPLMLIVPANAQPRVELYVPTRAAGFLAVGQEVRLSVDAFPFQQYGTIRARIAEIATAASPRTLADGTTAPVYLVTADLDAPFVLAFGRRQPLLPGMTLSARIVTERRRLFEWLFDPLFAVSDR